MSDLQEFRSRVNHTFQMRLDDGPMVDVVLTECDVRPDEASYTLTFVGAPDAPAVQGTHVLSAPAFGPMPVFLVPLRRDADGVAWHAVFNQPEGAAR